MSLRRDYLTRIGVAASGVFITLALANFVGPVAWAADPLPAPSTLAPTDTPTADPTPTAPPTPTSPPTPDPTPTAQPSASAPAASEPVEPRPDALTINSVLPSATGLWISFSGPNNGANVQYIRVVLNGVSRTASGTSSPITIDGLTPDTAYSVAIRAGNPAGDGPLSTAFNTRTLAEFTKPDAPTLTTVAATSTSITIRIGAPARDGGAPISSFNLTGGGVDPQKFATPGERTFSNLQPGREYTFTATATNRIGTSNVSSLTVKTLATAPSPVQGLAAAAERGVATIRWSAPATDNGSPITGYTATLQGIGTCGVGPTVTSCTIPGLQPNVATPVSVVATNAAGSSVAATTNVTFVATVPGPPAAVSVSYRGAGGIINKRMMTMRFSPSTVDGGLPITSYTLTATYDRQSYKNGTSYQAPPQVCTITAAQVAQGVRSCELEKDIYAPWEAREVTAIATNALGNSRKASANASYELPDPLRNVRAVPGDRQITVYWDPQNQTGVNAATSVDVTVSDFIFLCSAPPSAGQCVVKTHVDPFVNGRKYQIRVSSRNGYGKSEPIDLEATPFGPPGQPGVQEPTGGNGLVTVRWFVGPNGGRPVTQFRVLRAGTSTPLCVRDATGGLWTQYSCEVPATNNVSVKYDVQARNDAGWGPVATTKEFTPLRGPSAPLGVTAKQIGNQQVEISWLYIQLLGRGVATKFDVLSADGKVVCSATADARSCSTWGVTAGQAHTFRVRASAGDNVGDISSPSAPLYIAAVPNIPQNPTATVGDRTATVRWSTPIGGGIPDRYVVYLGSGARGCTVNAPMTQCTVTGLQNLTAYQFYVVGENSAGPGGGSAFTTAQVVGRPLAPTNVRTEVTGRQVRVFWVEGLAAMTPSVSSFTAGVPGVSTCTTSGTERSCLLTDLPLNKDFTISVSATNDAGSVRSLDVATIALRTPSAPRDSSVRLYSSGVDVQWTPPAVLGNTGISEYFIRRADGSVICQVAWPARNCWIPASNLVAGTSYTLTVAARNTIGEGASASVTFVFGAPNKPTNVKFTQNGTNAEVSWTAAEAGLTPVQGYVVRTSSGKSCTTSATVFKCALSNLTPGTKIELTVAATNPGAVPAVSTVAVQSWPKVPTNVRAIGSDRQITIIWDAADGNEFQQVTKYEVWSTTSVFLLGGEKVCDVDGLLNSCTVRNLKNGDNYIFWVVAQNGYGDSDRGVSNKAFATNVPEVVSGPAAKVSPTSIKVVQDGDRLLVRWDPTPNAAGARLVRYTAIISWADDSVLYPYLTCDGYSTQCLMSVPRIEAQLPPWWSSVKRRDAEFIITVFAHNGWNDAAEGSTGSRFTINW